MSSSPATSPPARNRPAPRPTAFAAFSKRSSRRIARPGEDAAAAQRGETLQRVIELKAQAKTNIQSAQSYLDATDSSLSSVSKLLTDVKSAALAAASDTASDESRQAAAEQV